MAREILLNPITKDASLKKALAALSIKIDIVNKQRRAFKTIKGRYDISPSSGVIYESGSMSSKHTMLMDDKTSANFLNLDVVQVVNIFRDRLKNKDAVRYYPIMSQKNALLSDILKLDKFIIESTQPISPGIFSTKESESKKVSFASEVVFDRGLEREKRKLGKVPRIPPNHITDYEEEREARRAYTPDPRPVTIKYYTKDANPLPGSASKVHPAARKKTGAVERLAAEKARSPQGPTTSGGRY